MTLQRVILDNGSARLEWIPYQACALLQHVRELVPEQLLSRCRVGIVLAWREENPRAVCERQRANGTGFRSHVDANGREIGAKCRLHSLPHVTGQRLTFVAAEA
jgi:hypothetical protein